MHRLRGRLVSRRPFEPDPGHAAKGAFSTVAALPAAIDPPCPVVVRTAGRPLLEAGATRFGSGARGRVASGPAAQLRSL
jgi:hypothetical protein